MILLVFLLAIILVCSIIPVYKYFCGQKSISAPIGSIVFGITVSILSLIIEAGSLYVIGGVFFLVAGVIWYFSYKEKENNGVFEQERTLELQQIEQEREQAIVSQNLTEPWAIKYMTSPCPHCGHYKVRYAKWEDKRYSVAFWGVASDKLGKSFKCEHCGKMW